LQLAQTKQVRVARLGGLRAYAVPNGSLMRIWTVGAAASPPSRLWWRACAQCLPTISRSGSGRHEWHVHQPGAV